MSEYDAALWSVDELDTPTIDEASSASISNELWNPAVPSAEGTAVGGPYTYKQSAERSGEDERQCWPQM